MRLPTEEELLKSICEDSLHDYIQAAWKIIEPGITYIDNWHIEAICEYLQAVYDGQIHRLLINVPPRYMKSISVTVGFPTWVWTKDAYKRIISLSYAATLSKKHNINRRDIIQSPWYQRNWGDCFKLKDDKNTQMVFENDKMGFMFATSIGGTLTGEGGDIIIVDDPHNPQQAQSDAERETALEFFKTTLPTRLNDKKKGAIIVVMQRLHDDDISGHCLREGGYEHLCLPGIAEKRQVITFPITLKEKVREEGDILWPAREDKSELEKMKRSLGSYGFSGQYQQAPSPSEGGMIKRRWWQYYKELPKMAVMAMSVDASFTDTKSSAKCSIQVWGKREADIYMIDNVTDNMDFVVTIQKIKQLLVKYPQIGAKYIEEKANGYAIITMLSRKVGGFIPIKADVSTGGKVARALAVTPYIEAGNVYLPEDAVWTNDFVEECAKFPVGTYKDQVDAMSQILNKFIYFPAEVFENANSKVHWALSEEEKKEPGYVGTDEPNDRYLGGW
jgi:predicted phage terminase large subunit-like protein